MNDNMLYVFLAKKKKHLKCFYQCLLQLSAKRNRAMAKSEKNTRQNIFVEVRETKLNTITLRLFLYIKRKKTTKTHGMSIQSSKKIKEGPNDPLQ